MRKAKPKKRVILPDPVFNDQKVSKFVNHLMYDGKKNASYEIFYAALETVYVTTLYVVHLILQVLLVVLKDALNTELSVRNQDKLRRLRKNKD